ncbi:hypothetical protein B0H19DRAFT_952531 [Mycena capillaripes]|nr:hypothetical protein B0H19DRAFT_952531 [Mycena capillaripes]
MSVNKIQSAELQLLRPENLKMLPILVLGLFKKVSVSSSSSFTVHLNTEMALDVRAYTRVLLTSAALEQLIQYISPHVYSLHNMPDEVSVVTNGILGMPTPLPLTSAVWESQDLYLIDDGQIIYLVVARDAVPPLINDVFGLSYYQALQGGKLELPEVDTAISQRIRSIIGKIRERKGAVHYPATLVVKDDATFKNPGLIG